MNSCNYTDAEFAEPGIFTITRKKEWLSQSLEYSERHRHEWKHIKIDHKPVGKEVLNDAWKKKKKNKLTTSQWLLQEKLTKRRKIG